MRYLSILLRPSFLLILGLALGYYFGFSAAYHGGDSIGARVAIAIGHVDPEQVRAEHQARTGVLRDTVQARSGVIVP